MCRRVSKRRGEKEMWAEVLVTGVAIAEIDTTNSQQKNYYTNTNILP
jgi:hypothetical protein